MAKVNGLILNEIQILGGETACLTGQRELREYVNGKVSDRIIGTRFDVVAHTKNF